MQKMTKGAIAAAAAALLLVGGGGTFMSWNDNVTQTDQEIAAGNLALTPGDGKWTLNGTDVTAGIGSVQLVPGDNLVFTQSIGYVTSGNNLNAELSLAPGAIEGVTASDADAALATQLVNNAAIDLTVNGELPTGITGSGGTYTFEGETSGDLTATVTIEFPFDAEGDSNASRTGNVNLSGMALSFTQNKPVSTPDV